MASRSQTKPEISPKIGAKSKASTIRLQPYITLPYMLKKSGTSVDVKVDVKIVTEWRRRREGPGSVFYVDECNISELFGQYTLNLEPCWGKDSVRQGRCQVEG